MKTTALLLSLTLLATLSGCGGSSEDGTGQGNPGPGTGQGGSSSGGSGQAGSAQGGKAGAISGGGAAGATSDPCAGKACGDYCTPDGPTTAAPAYCNTEGACTYNQPSCGPSCTADTECAAPATCMVCPDGSTSCAKARCFKGACDVYYDACPAAQCQQASDCPVDAGCKVCPDGTESCPIPRCNEGVCQQVYPPCKAAECTTPDQCPTPAGPCQVCPDGSTRCPSADCVAGKCTSKFEMCPATGPCEPMQAEGVGDCKKLLGYRWDGKGCAPVTGCQCAGVSCGSLFAEQASCEKAHAECKSPYSCVGKQCGDLCGPPCDGPGCTATYCNENGQCSTTAPECLPPWTECKLPSDCPPVPIPCQLCPDGSSACPKIDCLGGKCSYDLPVCPPSNPCQPMKLDVAPGCDQLLGWGWNGGACYPLVGCLCDGPACNILWPSQEACEKDQIECTFGGSCLGKQCGALCTGYCPPGQSCPQRFCDLDGVCADKAPVCEPPTGCKTSLDCAQPGGICLLCPDGSTACDSVVCQDNQCVYLPAECADPTDPCAPDDALGAGFCEAILGHKWDGAQCVMVVGCECVGAGCVNLTPDQASCEAKHQMCGLQSCAGKACGESCSPVCPPGESCPQWFCDAVGACTTISPECPPPPVQCLGDADCPPPECIDCQLGGKTCGSVSCVSGKCIYQPPVCKTPCDAQDAAGKGGCPTFLGYKWDGVQCTGISGCNCEGIDCLAVYQDYDLCVKEHESCLVPF